VLKLAWRNIWRNSRRSLLAAGTVACAIAFVMGALTFLNGFSAAIEEDLLLKSGHVRVVHSRYVRKQHVLSLRSAVPDAPALARRLRAMPEIRDVREQVTFAASVDTDGEHQYPLVVVGFDTQRSGMLDRLRQCLRHGSLDGLDETLPSGPRRLVLGTDAARRCGGVAVGQSLVVIATGRNGSLCARDFDVAAIVDMEAPNLDLMGYAPLADVRELLDMEAMATELVVYVHSPRRLARLAERMATAVGADTLTVQPWYEVGSVGSFINGHYRLGALVALLILFVAAVCVSNTMIMAVLERTSEMGLLAALGFTRRQVVGLFMAESLLLALLAVVPGTLVGGAVSSYLQTVGIFWGTFTAFPLRSVAYGRFEPWIWCWAVAAGCGTALAASVGPILRRTTLRPSEALRNP